MMTIAEWVVRHAEQQSYAYHKTSENHKQAEEKNKRLYDQTTRDAPLLPGEWVLVVDHRSQNKGKLRSPPS